MTDQHNPLPPLPEPDTLDWCNGEDAPESAFSKEVLIEYGQACAAHARKVALEDAKQAVLDWLRPESEDMRHIETVLEELK